MKALDAKDIKLRSVEGKVGAMDMTVFQYVDPYYNCTGGSGLI